MDDSDKDLTTRGTPAETKDDWKHIWSGVDKAHTHNTKWDDIQEGVKKAHDGWFVVKFPVFIFGNWRVLVVGAAGAAAMFGHEIATALGYLK